MKSKFNFSNIMAYLQGWWRYKLYYSRFKFLIRTHILEQIDFRIKYMDKECYENGSCKLCGCATTALQMANKQCNKPCYPPILNKGVWNLFKKGNRTIYRWTWYHENAGNIGLREYLFYNEPHGIQITSYSDYERI